MINQRTGQPVARVDRAWAPVPLPAYHHDDERPPGPMQYRPCGRILSVR